MEDEELEKIRMRKVKEMLGKASRGEEKDIASQVPAEPIEVTDANFNEVTQNHPVVVVDCWAPWCPPCRMIAPIIEELAKEYAGKILFGKLNVDNNQRTALEYGIMSIPTLLIFKDSKLVDRIVGAVPKRMLESRISRYL
ncbi:MAG: thioredoxin [Candidatus Bathyarchaeia archaeon]